MNVVGTLVIIVFLTSSTASADYEVVTAINVGGEAHVDSFGIYYHKDNNMQGTSYVCDKYSSVSGLVSPKDEYIYKSYRQDFKNYDLEVEDDGDYLLILKFLQCESTYAGYHIMNIQLNARHTVISYLDIFEEVGAGAALDVYVPFRVCNGQVHHKYEISQLFGNSLRVEFTTKTGNVVCSGLVLIKGDYASVPESIWPNKNDYNLKTTECVAPPLRSQVGGHQRVHQLRGYLNNLRPIVLNFYNSSLNFGFLVDQVFNVSTFEYLQKLNETLVSSS
jgi:Malectin domain